MYKYLVATWVEIIAFLNFLLFGFISIKITQSFLQSSKRRDANLLLGRCRLLLLFTKCINEGEGVGIN